MVQALNTFVEMMRFGFMQRAFLAAIGIGVVTTLAGFFVVYRQLSFAGVGIAHASFGGIALAVLLGFSPTLGAALFALLIALLIAGSSRQGALSEDSTIGIFFSAAMALGTVLVAHTSGYSDLFGYLFGNILAVSAQDLWVLLVAGGAVVAFFVLFFRDLLAIAFSAELAAVDGKPVAALEYGLLLAVAATVVLAVRMTGIVLVSALLVIPAATARLWSRHYPGVLGFTLAFNLGSSVAGLILSYFFDWPSGGTIVLVATVLFLISLAFQSLPTGRRQARPGPRPGSATSPKRTLGIESEPKPRPAAGA